MGYEGVNMKIVNPKVILRHVTPDAEALIELSGRVCYKSESQITKKSSSKFIKMLIKRGHESVLEHANATFVFTTDRGVTHEDVRHRICSYSQESTRYCSYKGEVSYIKPTFELLERDLKLLLMIEEHYQWCIEIGRKPQEARYFLPNGLKTEIVHTANLREWRHIFKLRCAKTAHPQIRQIMLMALLHLYDRVPNVFEDLYLQYQDEIFSDSDFINDVETYEQGV